MTAKTIIIKDRVQKRQGIPSKSRLLSYLDKVLKKMILNFFKESAGYPGMLPEASALKAAATDALMSQNDRGAGAGTALLLPSFFFQQFHVLGYKFFSWSSERSNSNLRSRGKQVHAHCTLVLKAMHEDDHLPFCVGFGELTVAFCEPFPLVVQCVCWVAGCRPHPVTQALAWPWHAAL